MWAGGLCNVEYVVYGAVVFSVFGLSLWQALLVIAVSNVTFLLAGLASLQGPAAGTSAFAIARAPFGPTGARGVSIFNWVTMVAYETEGLVLIVLAVVVLLHKAGLPGARVDAGGIHGSPGLLVGVVLVAAAAQGVLPLLGYATILKVLKAVTVPFTVLFVILAVVALPKMHVTANHAGAGWVGLSEAFAFAISATGLGWTIQANDYSRYLPAGTPRVAVVRAVSIGSFVPASVLMGLGAAVATAFPAASTDPISGLSQAVPGWFLVPYLLVAGIQLLAINTLDLYSSGLTLQAVGVPISRMRAVGVDLVVSAGLTLVALLLTSVDHFINNLITLLIVWVAPWTGVYLVDWLLRRGRYEPARLVGADLARRWQGTPGVLGGFRLAGVVSMGAGMVASALWVATPVFTGPLASALGTGPEGFDLSIPAGLLVGGGLYWVLARGTVPAEAAGTGEVVVTPRL